MKKVSSTSVGRNAKSGEFEFVTVNKPSLLETVTKYGGTVRDSDFSGSNGKLEFKSGTLGEVGGEKSIDKKDIYFNGKIIGSKG